MQRHPLEMTPVEVANREELTDTYWGFTDDLAGVSSQEVQLQENKRSVVATVPKALFGACLPDGVEPEDLVGRKVSWQIDPHTGNLVLDINGKINGNRAVWE